MKRLVAGFVAGMLVWSTATAVLAAGTSQTIRACVKSSTGAMRIVSATATCKTGEKLLTWNTIGPQGAQGPQGPAGPAGGTDIYLAANIAERPTVDNRDYGHWTVASLQLPTGNYLINARVFGYAERTPAGNDYTRFDCCVGVFTFKYQDVFGGALGYGPAIFVMADVAVLTKPTTVSLVCGPVTPGADAYLSVGNVMLSALPANNVLH